MYEFAKVNPHRYTFETETGFVYGISLSPLDFVFRENDELIPLIFELSIEILSDFDKLPPRDKKIELTVSKIVKSIFEKEKSIFAIYHVSNIDKRAISRKKLFQKWFDNNNINFLEKHDKMIEDEFEVFYISLLLRKDNPQKEKILESFNQWIDDTNATK